MVASFSGVTVRGHRCVIYNCRAGIRTELQRGDRKGRKWGDEGRERHRSSGSRLTRQACHVAAPTQGCIHPAQAQHNQASAAKGGGGTTVGYHDNQERLRTHCAHFSLSGVDHQNKDLTRNFEALASFDVRSAHGLSHDPMPVQDELNSHGTRCAGEVAMEANNSYCGVGIAFNARIGGIRLLDGPVTDAMEATALTFNFHFIDIYVCSWGPRDDGATMDGPAVLTEQALWLGTHKASPSSQSPNGCLSLRGQIGRRGKGSIFVWAAGNGGLQLDHCGADGYVNSIYNIAIGAVSHAGKPAYFGEPCPGVMAVTLSGARVGGSLPLVTVTVTSSGDGCVEHFQGTSSAAPIAAGILALVLEV
ncbi:Proprotein convertase subtilisin/kexin type 5, partial [Takifugu flavidus]